MPIPKQQRAGTPSPDRWIVHERVTTDAKGIEGRDTLRAGAVCVNAEPLSALMTCAGASRVRGRLLSTADGELKIEFVRPLVNSHAIETYAAGNPTPVAVTGDRETLITSADLAGEALALVTFTPSEAGAITFFDWMAL